VTVLEASLKNFREESFKKFVSLPSENSEIFKKQTAFKEFESQSVPREISDDMGIKILEKPEKIKIVSLDASGLGEFYKRMDVDDKFVQMNNAFFDSGVLIEVPKNVSAGMLRVSSSVATDVFSKMIIVMGDGSDMSVVKESYSQDDKPHSISEDTLVVLGEGSKMDFSELQNYNTASDCFSNKMAFCSKDSGIVWNLGMFGGSKTRSRTYNFLEGDGSSAEDLQLTFGDGDQSFDSFSNLMHIGKSTVAKNMSKGAFKDRSASIMKGMINIGEQARGANSYLACHGMLLSKQAKANAVPSLEIKTNEVKATHSASVSPIDEEKIFYLTCRGMDREEARKMLTLGFFDPLIRRISSDEIRAKVRYLVEMKWRGLRTDSFESKMLKEFVAEDAIKSGDVFEGHYKYRRSP